MKTLSHTDACKEIPPCLYRLCSDLINTLLCASAVLLVSFLCRRSEAFTSSIHLVCQDWWLDSKKWTVNMWRVDEGCICRPPPPFSVLPSGKTRKNNFNNTYSKHLHVMKNLYIVLFSPFQFVAVSSPQLNARDFSLDGFSRQKLVLINVPQAWWKIIHCAALMILRRAVMQPPLPAKSPGAGVLPVGTRYTAAATAQHREHISVSGFICI